jgi:hypothetical protein
LSLTIGLVGSTHIPHKSGWFLQTPLGAFTAMMLWTGTAKRGFLPDPFDVGAARGATAAVKGEVGDSEIDPEHLRDADLCGGWYVTDNGEIPLTTHDGEQSTLAFAADERNPHPAENPDAHHVVGDEPEYAIVVGLGGRLAEPDNARSCAGLLRRLGNLGEATHRGLRCRCEALTGVSIDELVQGEPRGNAGVKARCEIALQASIAALKRIAERLRLLRCRCQ